MAIVRRSIEEGAVSPGKLLAALKDGTYWYERFGYQPLLVTAVTAGYGAPTGVTGDQNKAHFQGGQTRYVVLGGGQTILGPALDGTVGGLDISQDQTATEGVEHLIGGEITAVNPFVATIGGTNQKNLFFEIDFTLSADGGAGSECALGFRKAEAFQALIDNYDEAAFLNVISGDIFRETILNGAATVTTDTTLNWLAGERHKLGVRLEGRTVRFFVDGVEVTLGGPFQFDDAEVVVPFFHFLQGATPATCVWHTLEVGFTEDVDPFGS